MQIVVTTNGSVCLYKFCFGSRWFRTIWKERKKGRKAGRRQEGMKEGRSLSDETCLELGQESA